jgi:ABC-2 type transport system permease protein
MDRVRVVLVYVRMSALNELQYRANFWLQLVKSLVGLGTALAGLAVVFNQTDELDGWGRDELLALVGVYFLVGAAVNLVFVPSLGRFMQDVRLGTLDYTLTKPEDAQLLISVRQVEVWRVIDVALGLGVLGVALGRLGGEVGPGQALAFGATLLAGGATVYAFLLMLATTSFWFVRVENILYVFQGMYEAGRWPVGIYPPWLRATLTFLVPIAFAITVPASGLVGRLAWTTALGSVALAVALLAVSRWFWLRGVRRYSGASA